MLHEHSVDPPTWSQLFFRNKVEDEQGYVLYVRKNALQILIPKYGLEGTLYLDPRKSHAHSKVQFIYNEEEQTQSCGDVVFHPFDPVTVQLSLDRSNLQHEKVVLQLVKPIIPDFSVPSQAGAPSNKRDVEEKRETSDSKNKRKKKK